MKITPRERKLLIVAGVIVAGLLGTYLVTPFLSGEEGTASALELKKRMLMKHWETLGQEEFHKTRVQQYRERLNLDMTRLLPGTSPTIAAAELQRVMKEIADRSGVEITRKDSLPQQKTQDQLIKVAVRIETNCDPDQLVQFLSAIENYEKYLTVDELAISSFRLQKRYDIRPNLTIAGYIAAPEEKPEKAEKVSSGS